VYLYDDSTSTDSLTSSICRAHCERTTVRVNPTIAENKQSHPHSTLIPPRLNYTTHSTRLHLLPHSRTPLTFPPIRLRQSQPLFPQTIINSSSVFTDLCRGGSTRKEKSKWSMGPLTTASNGLPSQALRSVLMANFSMT